MKRNPQPGHLVLIIAETSERLARFDIYNAGGNLIGWFDISFPFQLALDESREERRESMDRANGRRLNTARPGADKTNAPEIDAAIRVMYDPIAGRQRHAGRARATHAMLFAETELTLAGHGRASQS